MAFGGGPSGGAGVNNAFTGGSKAASTTSFGVAYATSFSVGALIAARCVSDNLATTTGASANHSSATDDAGNTYTKVGEWTKTSGSAGSGVTVSWWFCVLAHAVTTSNTFTVNFSAGITAKGIEGYKFTIGADSTVALDGSIQTSTSSTTATLTAGSLSNVEHLVHDSLSYEGAAASGFTETSWNVGNAQGTTGGSASTNVGTNMLEQIATASTSVSSTPSSTLSPTNFVRFMFTLKEVAGSVSLTPTKGSLALGGKTPTVTLNLNVSPSVGHVTLSGKVPTVTQINVLAASTGHLVLTGKTPSVVSNINVVPVTGHEVLTGYVPTVSVGFAVSPVAGHLTLGGNAPSVSTTLNPATGHIVFAGRVPSLGLAVNSSAGHLQLSGGVPTITASISPLTGHLTLSGHVPSLTYSTSALGRIKVSLGGFVAKPVKIWDGSAWVAKPLKYWTGAIWRPTTY